MTKTLINILLLSLVLTGCQYTKVTAPSKSNELTLALLCELHDEEEDAVIYAWPHNGKPSCSDPFRLRWETNTISYYIDDSIEMPYSIKAAFYQWNVWIGRELFAEAKYGEDAQISVFRIFSGNSNTLAWTMVGRVEGSTASIIALLDGYVTDPFKIAAHEIGHALGLDHDQENMLSLMHPIIHSGPMLLTHDDQLALRRLYATPL
jgi:hypothetical protein